MMLRAQRNRCEFSGMADFGFSLPKTPAPVEPAFNEINRLWARVRSPFRDVAMIARRQSSSSACRFGPFDDELSHEFFHYSSVRETGVVPPFAGLISIRNHRYWGGHPKSLAPLARTAR